MHFVLVFDKYMHVLEYNMGVEKLKNAGSVDNENIVAIWSIYGNVDGNVDGQE